MSLFRNNNHDFDLKKPILDDVEIIEKHSLNNETITKIQHLTGWVCKKCGKVLWLDEWMMKDLPKDMIKGCGDKQIQTK